VARHATVVAVSYAEAGVALGQPDTFVTGTPIRRADIDPDEARARFGARPGERVLLVFGGSQAVRRINDAVEAALPRLVEKARVVHVTGDDGYGAALAAREQLPEDLRDRYRPHPFLHGDDMTAALGAADLAVGRAGASTLAEAAAFALPTAIVPYPHASGHQRLNAVAFADAGAAILVEDEDLDAAKLLEVAGLLADPSRHARMSAAARELARPDAAGAVAELVLAVAHRDHLPSQAEIEAVARGAKP
jgi:UDP-N-acetylglucosamine--N-acetylmuramyl-(pentapeptide) pyrophosphoryl-undecaprenol N-acetylglucosamine transferase